MRQLAKTLEPQSGTNTTFFKASFDIGITFGETELKAFIEWRENVCALHPSVNTNRSFTDRNYPQGAKKRGPATVIPDSLT